jgi:hypothetical protein
MGIERITMYGKSPNEDSWQLTNTKREWRHLFEVHALSRWDEIARVGEDEYETYLSRPTWYMRLL